MQSYYIDGVIRAQSWLKGKVVVEVQERMAIGDGVTIELTGKELTHIPSNCFSWPCQTVNEHVVFEEERRIHNFTKKLLEPGIYSYVFTLYIPGTVPPSMRYEEEDECLGCSVEYVLKAKIGEIFQAQRKLKVVGPPLSKKIYPYMVQPTCYPFTSWFMDHGYIVLGARMEDSHVGKGQALEVSFASRNKSRKDIERIEVQVIEQIDWKTNTHQRETRCIPIVDIGNAILPGLVTEKEIIAMVDERDQASVDGLMYAQMHCDLMAKRNRMQLTIPSWARDSYSGKLLKVSHCLKVTPVTSCKSNDPVIKIPVKVFDAPIESILHSSIRFIPDNVTTSWPNEVAVPIHSDNSTTSVGSLHEIEE